MIDHHSALSSLIKKACSRSSLISRLVLVLTGLILALPAYSATVMVIGDSISAGSGQASYRMAFYQTLDADGCAVDMVGDQTLTSYDYRNPIGAPGYHFPFFDPVTHPEHLPGAHWDPALADDTDHQAFPSISADQLLNGVDLPQNGFDTVLPIGSYVANEQPDYVLLHIGTNDINNGITLGAATTQELNTLADDTVVDIQQIVDAIFLNHQNPAGVTILLANVIENGLSATHLQASAIFTAKLNTSVANLHDSRVFLVDVATGYDANTMSNDGIHPHAVGERHVADVFLDIIKGVGLCNFGGGPAITLPLPGDTILGSSTAINWLYPGTDVTEWQVYVGGSQSGFSDDYLDSGVITDPAIRSVNVATLPGDGSIVYVAIHYKIAGLWNYTIFSFFSDAVTTTPPSMSSPVPGSLIDGGSATFTWTPNTTSVVEWRLEVGSSLNGSNYHDSGVITNPGILSATVSGLPQNCSTVYVNLSYAETSGNFQILQYRYTGGGGGNCPMVDTPVPGSSIDGSSATFNWVTNGTTVLQWRFEVGSTFGGAEYHDTGRITDPATLSAIVSGLPEDGSTIYVELSYKQSNGYWVFVHHTYTSAVAGGQDMIDAVPTLTNPASAGTVIATNEQLAGSASDTGGAGLNYVTIAIKDLAPGGQWLDISGTGSATYQTISATLTNQLPDTADWTVDLNFPGGTSGSFFLIVTAMDNAGNYSSIFSNFKMGGLDTVAPVPVTTNPTQGQVVAANEVFTGSATDTGGAGLAYVTVAIKELGAGGQWLDLSGTPSATYLTNPTNLSNVAPDGSAADWDVALNFPSTTGDFFLIVTAVDSAGNFSSISSTFKMGAVDAIDPVATRSVPVSGGTATVTTLIQGTATDTGGSGLNYVTVAIKNLTTDNWLLLDGSPNALYQTSLATITTPITDGSNWEAQLAFPPGTTGIFFLSITPVDGAGNFSSLNSTFTIN